jgi:hypothetical protein
VDPPRRRRREVLRRGRDRARCRLVIHTAPRLPLLRSTGCPLQPRAAGVLRLARGREHATIRGSHRTPNGSVGSLRCASIPSRKSSRRSKDLRFVSVASASSDDPAVKLTGSDRRGSLRLPSLGVPTLRTRFR